MRGSHSSWFVRHVRRSGIARPGVLRSGVLALAVTGVAVTLVGLAAVPASAGGPTSVLVVSPARQVTALAYTSDAEYAVLATALGDTPVAEEGAPEQTLGPGGTQINVTWLAHDVWVWRVDRVVLDSDGVPWVNTFVNDSGKVSYEQDGIWHRARTPRQLVGLLTSWGMLGEGADAAGPAAAGGEAPAGAGVAGAGVAGAGVAGAGVAGAGEAAGEAAATRATTSTGTPGGTPGSGAAADGLRWWALLPALAIGGLGGALGRPVTRRLRAAHAARLPRKSPRQELVDV